MNDTRLETIDQIEAFLLATQTLEFSIEDKTERYEWIQCTLVRFNYRRLSKAEKGWVMQYLAKITGYSPAQTKRLSHLQNPSKRVELVV